MPEVNSWVSFIWLLTTKISRAHNFGETSLQALAVGFGNKDQQATPSEGVSYYHNVAVGS